MNMYTPEAHMLVMFRMFALTLEFRTCLSVNVELWTLGTQPGAAWVYNDVLDDRLPVG